MAAVVLFVHPARADARELAVDTARWLACRGHRARVLRVSGIDAVTDEHGEETPLGSVDLHGIDLAVSMGGDGTLLRLVPLAWAAGVPVLGVNFGRVGYLLELEPGQLLEALERALRGDVVIEERSVLSMTLPVGDGTVRLGDRSLPEGEAPEPDGLGPAGRSRSVFAFNEIVLEKTVFGHTVHLSTAIDGEAFLDYSADGLLIATPTGSTAYNLSAGGPVVSPRLRGMVVTPVAPHLALDRSLVLHPDQAVGVTIGDGRPAVLVVDGQEAGRLAPGAVVTCRVARAPVRLATMGRRGFGSLLRNAVGTRPVHP